MLQPGRPGSALTLLFWKDYPQRLGWPLRSSGWTSVLSPGGGLSPTVSCAAYPTSSKVRLQVASKSRVPSYFLHNASSPSLVWSQSFTGVLVAFREVLRSASLLQRSSSPTHFGFHLYLIGSGSRHVTFKAFTEMSASKAKRRLFDEFHRSAHWSTNAPAGTGSHPGGPPRTA